MLGVDPKVKELNDLVAQIIALANKRDSATRTDYAHPRFKDIVKLLEEFRRQK